MTPIIEVHIERVPGATAEAGLAALCDALVVAHGGEALDAAITIAHHRAGELPHATRRRVLEDVATNLREKLTAVEAQLREAK